MIHTFYAAIYKNYLKINFNELQLKNQYIALSGIALMDRVMALT